MKGRSARRLASHALLSLLVIASLSPFLFMVLASLKSNEQFYHAYFAPSLPLRWGNYAEAWVQVGGYLINSITVTAVSVTGSLLFAGLAAYAFARYRFPGSRVLYLAVLIVLLIPGTLTLIPAFVILRKLGLIGSHAALYAVYITETQVLGLLVLRSFFAGVPDDLLEAATLDGAGDVATAARVVMPLAKPAFLTVAIMSTLSCWNDYLWPLITLPDSRLWTVTQGLVAFRDRYAGMSAWGPLFAGFVIASVPLFILFFASMRHFVSGLTSGAMKA